MQRAPRSSYCESMRKMAMYAGRRHAPAGTPGRWGVVRRGTSAAEASGRLLFAVAALVTVAGCGGLPSDAGSGGDGRVLSWLERHSAVSPSPDPQLVAVVSRGSTRHPRWRRVEVEKDGSHRLFTGSSLTPSPDLKMSTAALARLQGALNSAHFTDLPAPGASTAPDDVRLEFEYDGHLYYTSINRLPTALAPVLDALPDPVN